MSLSQQEGEFGHVFVLTVLDTDSAPHEFTGDETVVMYVNKPGADAVAVGSGSVYDADDGIIHVEILEADVATLTHGIYEVRLKISDASQVLIPEPGRLEVGRGV